MHTKLKMRSKASKHLLALHRSWRVESTNHKDTAANTIADLLGNPLTITLTNSKMITGDLLYTNLNHKSSKAVHLKDQLHINNNQPHHHLPERVSKFLQAVINLGCRMPKDLVQEEGRKVMQQEELVPEVRKEEMIKRKEKKMGKHFWSQSIRMVLDLMLT